MAENKLAGLLTTKAELGYVHGLTSAIQTQLDALVGGGSGSGDVVGPDEATVDHVALFSDTTGKVIKDGGAALIAAGWLEVDGSGDLEPSITFLLSNTLEADNNGDLMPV